MQYKTKEEQDLMGGRRQGEEEEDHEEDGEEGRSKLYSPSMGTGESAGGTVIPVDLELLHTIHPLKSTKPSQGHL